VELTESERHSIEALGASPEVKSLLDRFRVRLRKNKDVSVVITGFPGSGKSTLSMQLAMLLDPNFTFEKNVLFDPTVEDMHNAIYKLPEGSVIVVDEAIRVGNRKNWNTRRNKVLNEMLALCRFKNKIIFFNIPFFKTIDSDLQLRLLTWIHVPRTGFAVVFVKSQNPFTGDPWALNLNDKLYGKAIKNAASYSFKRLMRVVPRLPSFLTAFDFKKLPARIEREYDKHKPKEFELGLEEKENRREVRLRKSVSVLLAELCAQGRSLKDISRLTGFSYSTVRKYAEAAGVNIRELKAKQRRKKEEGKLRVEREASLIPSFEVREE